MSPINLINVIFLLFHLYLYQMRLSHFYKTLAFKFSNPISFEHPVYDEKKKEKRTERSAVSRPHFSTICQNPSGPSPYLLLTPFSLLFYRILICIASHRLAAGCIRTRGNWRSHSRCMWVTSCRKRIESGTTLDNDARIEKGLACN